MNTDDTNTHTNDTGEKFVNFIKIISRLRGPDGCPWDMKQTPQSLKTYLIEEAHELMEALEADNPAHVREELGDLLFQIVLLNNIYAEKNYFNMDDVIETITAKMIRRHPHVFADSEAKTEEELRRQWISIKSREKGKKNTPGALLSSIPKSLPALRRAHRISERAARTGFEWPDMEEALDKLDEEIREFKEAMRSGRREEMFEEMGDILLTLVNVGRLAGANSEEALQSATAKFTDRFAKMEQILEQSGKTFPPMSKEEMLEIWEEAKKQID